MADAVVRHVVTFGRVLREVGLEVGPGRVADALRGLDAVDLTRQDDVYFALRQTLVSRHDELELFDRAFNAWFLRAPVLPPRAAASRARSTQAKVGEALVGRLRAASRTRSGRPARARRLRSRAPAREGLRRDDAGRVPARASA